MEKTARGYRLSSGREFSANGLDHAGLVSIGRKRDGSFLIGEGYDGTLLGATGDEYDAPDPGERDPNWTLEERRELADFMIAQWAAFRARGQHVPVPSTPVQDQNSYEIGYRDGESSREADLQLLEERLQDEIDRLKQRLGDVPPGT